MKSNERGASEDAALSSAALSSAALFRRNKVFFGLGTVGRDMVYSLVSMYLMVFMTEAVVVSDAALLAITAVMTGARVFDALNDPFMGFVVDNTKSRWGKYKPWIAIGAVLSAVVTVFLFADPGLSESAYVGYFAVVYVLWGVSWTLNDIPYWSMMPSLSYDQKKREEIGSFARIAANVGLFAVVGAVIPATAALGGRAGSLRSGYFLFACVVVAILIVGQCLTLFGVRTVPTLGGDEGRKTSLRDMGRAIFRNDQLFVTAVSMALFMIGYVTTTSFGVYYFKYAYGDEGMYPVFAILLGVSQITALAFFPALGRRFPRKTLHAAAIAVIVFAYVLFFVSPVNMVFIGTAGVLLFAGQAFIQLLMLVYLADTIEYGHWKLGKRNESVSFALQPFINKIGGAAGSGILGVTLVASGINALPEGARASAGGITLMKSAMMLLPLALIVASYVIHRSKYVLDEATYGKILSDIAARAGKGKE